MVITTTHSLTTSICSAQDGLLLELSGVRTPELKPTVEILEAIRDSNLKPSRADLEYQVHWSRHLLACLQRITGAQLLVGARAVMFHPHFSHFVSPDILSYTGYVAWSGNKMARCAGDTSAGLLSLDSQISNTYASINT